MLKFLLFFFFSLLLFNTSFSQNYEFYGILKLDGVSKQMIPYKLVFTESNGKIKGYSITDFRGENETKNRITGTYDNKSKTLSIKERDIVYTKSPISKSLFCFVNFKSKIKLSNEKARINSAFYGLFRNNKKCIDGKVELIGSGTISKLLDKVDNKIQNSNEISPAEKDQYKAKHLFDSLQTQNLTDGQNLNVFLNEAKVTFEIWDGEIEDGDRVNFYFDGVKILSNYTVMKQKKLLILDLLNGSNKVKIEALNQGTQGLNTVMVKIVGDNSINFRTNLKTGQSTSVTIFKQ